MTDILSFEKLDLMLGDHAPFLMSLSDGLQEELHIVIAAAEVGEVGSISLILKEWMKVPNRPSTKFWLIHGP